jgi:hypothetical protein
MAIDATGTAWLFSTPWTPTTAPAQSVQKVNTADATCVGSAISIAAPNVVTGSAFSSRGGASETLYVSLANTASSPGLLTLGEFDTQQSVLVNVGTVANVPGYELDAFNWGQPLSANADGDLLVQNWWSGNQLYTVDPTVPKLIVANTLPDGLWNNGWWGETSAFWNGSLYYFASGWWNAPQNWQGVQRVDLSDLSLHQVLPQLGAYVLAATSGVACTQAAPPPPPKGAM